jgi:hypothetical protein
MNTNSRFGYVTDKNVLLHIFCTENKLFFLVFSLFGTMSSF